MSRVGPSRASPSQLAMERPFEAMLQRLTLRFHMPGWAHPHPPLELEFNASSWIEYLIERTYTTLIVGLS